jgi:hypothetical protein
MDDKITRDQIIEADEIHLVPHLLNGAADQAFVLF